MTLGTGEGKQASLRPWERPIGFWEGFRIRLAGLLDRIRARQVPDDKLTHYLIALQERAQNFQVDVVRWAASEDMRLETAIAAQQAASEQRVGEPAKAPAKPEAGASAKDLARWATSARDGDRAVADRERQRAQQAQAKTAIRSLQKQREGLAEQRDIHFAACRQWFDQRAALYNRARTGWLGLPKSSEHRIPEFVPIAFTGAKPGDVAELGDHNEEVTR